MSEVAIRPATPADIPSIAAIYSDCVRTGTASFEVEPPDEAEMLRRMTALVEGGHPYLAASEGDRLLGYAHAGPYRPRPAYRHAVEDSVYLAPEARGKGLGRRLLDVLIEATEVRGFRQMIAIIGDSGHEVSIRLHAAAGFAMVGTLKDVGHKHGRWLDTVIMQRALGPGATVPPAP